MVSNIGAKVNDEEFRAKMAEYRDKVPGALASALTEEVQIGFRQSQKDIPVLTGVAKNSGASHEAKQTGEGTYEASISYGGAASKYVERLNNDRSLRHPNGGKAGFATDPFVLRISAIQAGIISRVKRAMGKS